MSYKSILVHACEAGAADRRYRLAAHIALAEDAHLAGIAMSGMKEFMYRYAAALAVAPLAAEDLSFLTENARNELAAFDSAVRKAGVVAPGILLSDEEAAAALPWAARFCDLLVIGQHHIADAIIADSGALARALLVHAPCPVLVVPAGAPTAALPANILLAWDGSMEASRAVRAALPLLRRASSVVAASCQPFNHLADDGAPAAPLAAYLAHHGIALEAAEPADSGDPGRSLLALAARRGTELIVMGGFAHSRVREIVLGGVTRTMLAESTLPMLMAH